MVMDEECIESEEEEVTVKVKAQYLRLFNDICSEENEPSDEKLEHHLEKALAYFCLTQPGRGCRTVQQNDDYSLRRFPRADSSQIEKMLDTMPTLEAQLQWLKSFLKQLQQFQQTMCWNSSTLPTTTGFNYQKSLTPYILIYPRLVRILRYKIRQLEAKQRKLRDREPEMLVTCAH